jgi:hypothetical protein
MALLVQRIIVFTSTVEVITAATIACISLSDPIYTGITWSRRSSLALERKVYNDLRWSKTSIDPHVEIDAKEG